MAHRTSTLALEHALPFAQQYVRADPAIPQGISQFFVTAHVHACRELGYACDNAFLCEQGAPFRSVPRELWLRALTALRQQVADPKLASNLAAAMTDTRLHVLGTLMTAGTSVRQVVQLVAEHRRVLFGGDTWQIWHQQGRMWFGCAASETHRDGAVLEVQVALLLACRRFVQFLGDWCRPLLSVTFVDEQRVTHSGELAGVQVSYGAALNTFSFPDRLLDYKRPAADAALAQAIANVVRESVEVRGASWLEDVQNIVRSAARPARIDAHTTARALGVSSRTLRRKLEEEGTKWSVLHEQVLFQRACELLIKPRASAGSVAQLLGYDEAASFSRAFRRWSGVCPREYCRRERRADGFRGPL